MNTIVPSATVGNRIRIRPFGGWAVPIVLLVTVSAQAQDADKEDQEAAGRLTFMQESVSRVELAHADDPNSKFTILSEPVQRWNNLVSGVKDGTVFVWTLNGRPEVAAQVFQIPDGRWLQEFQSLSSDRLTGTHGGRRFWAPATAGVEMKPLSGADVPNPSPGNAVRRTQMRQIARQFKAIDIFEGKAPFHLRLLPQPLYEYGGAGNEIVHGGLFAFVHGTDPEVLLLVEAHKTNAELGWKIGFAPLTSYECLVTRNDAKYWTCPKRPPPNQPSETFLLHVYEGEKPE